MAKTVKGESKNEMVKAIVKMFHGAVSIKRATKMVEKAKRGEEVSVEVKVPTWFRFHDKNGHFVKTK